MAVLQGTVTTMSEALINTALGMGTVFVVLILISFVIYLFKFIPILFSVGKKKEQTSIKEETPIKTEPVEEKPVAKVSDDAQIVAVIAAAVAAAMEEETGVPVSADGLVIRSIKKRTFFS